MATYSFKSDEFADKNKNQIELSKSVTTKETFTIETLENQIVHIDLQMAKLTQQKTDIETKIADAKSALGI